MNHKTPIIPNIKAPAFNLFRSLKIFSLIILFPAIGFSQNFPFTIPELPPGKKVQIFYNVVVDNPLVPPTTSLIGRQDTVFLGPGLFFLSNDPATMAANDITLTPAAQFACNAYDGVVYVDQAATGGNNDGSSWANAFVSLQDGLLARIVCPVNVDTILVAEGTYYPTDDASLDSSFNIPDDVVVLGGFSPAVGDTALAERDWVCHETILSGDIDADGTLSGNSFHVVRTTNVSNLTVVDGFTITGGNSLNDGSNPSGGGWYNDGSGTLNSSNPTIRNIVFSGNQANNGGGLFNNGNDEGIASPSVTGCQFLGNGAFLEGGGMGNSGLDGGNSSPEIINCEFSMNFAAGGGAIANEANIGGVSSPLLVNCIFNENSAGNGGGLYNQVNMATSSPTIINCVFAGNNSSNSGGALHNNGFMGFCNPFFVNCLFFNNSSDVSSPVFQNNAGAAPSVQYSLFDEDFMTVDGGGGTVNGGNNLFSADPMFASFATGDFRLMPGSPAIDAGDNTANMEMEDLDGLSRVYNGTIDMGAYEWRPYCLPDTVYLDENGEGIVNETELIGELPQFMGCMIDTVLVVPTISCSDTAVLFDLFLIRDGMDTVFRCADTIWVLDTIAPVIDMIGMDLAVNEDCMAVMPDLSIYVSDNCALDTVIQSPEAGSLLGLPGTIVMVELMAVDSSGNESSISFQFEVVEVAPMVPLNCAAVIAPSINSEGQIQLQVIEVAQNATCLPVQDVQVLNQWGGVIWGATGLRNSDFILDGFDLCAYLGQTLEIVITNGLGFCTTILNLDRNAGLTMTSAFGTTVAEAADLGIPTALIDTGLLVTYCGFVPDPEDHEPVVEVSCNGRYNGLTAQPDWVEVFPCSEANDTSEIIYRTWEVFDKNGDLFTLTDTIVVLRLPMLTEASFAGYMEDTVYCEIETTLHELQPFEKRYASWKQPVGLHDYEKPDIKLQGLVYQLPLTIMAAGALDAYEQGEKTWLAYLNCVVLRKIDGTEFTVGDIIGNRPYSAPFNNDPFATDYMKYLTNNLHADQYLYGFVHAIYEAGEDPLSIIGGPLLLKFFPYLLLEKGDWILSENGNFEQVTEEWFFSSSQGSAQTTSPYWFAGAWPSIYGGGDCIRYADLNPNDNESGLCTVQVLVPALEADSCVAICLNELNGNPHCGISIESEGQDWAGTCPASRGQDITVTQMCWGQTENSCISEEYELTEGGENFVVTEVDITDKKRTFQISKWTTLLDTIGPIFDFCYPTENCEREITLDLEASNQDCESGECDQLIWCHEDIRESIRAGEQYPSARDWEYCYPTVYNTGSHDCSAEVFVPSVTLTDECSGIHHVKALVNGRAVLLKKVSEADGYVTFEHISNPIKIPFGGHGNLTEVTYEAADSCWNTSTWIKYIQIKDATPPTVVSNDARVTLNNQLTWVDAETFDEGSWDNCAIGLKLARRTDWLADTTIVNLCPVGKEYSDWIEVLVDLGFEESQVRYIFNGGSLCGDYEYDIEALKSFLGQTEIESHYYEKLLWLWEDGQACGSIVLHGWLYDIARYVSENCVLPDEHGIAPDPDDLIGFFDRLIGKTGYGREVAILGGGWSPAVPVTCADACTEVTVELLVMDEWCNWSTQWSTLEVEDKSVPKVIRRLEDLTITCEAYNLYYRDIVESASAFNNGIADSTEKARIFNTLDRAFGTYLTVGNNVNEQNLSDSSLFFDYFNVTCFEKSEEIKIPDTSHDGSIQWITSIVKTTYLDTITESTMNGLLSVTCAAVIDQDVWIDLDDCGYGTIIRRFFISGGCNSEDHGQSSLVIEQVIYIEPSCEVRWSMFDRPDDLGSKADPVCVPVADLVHDLPVELVGDVTLKPHLEGALCNSIAVGHTDKVARVLDADGMYKIIRTWSVKDWCSHAEGITYDQEIIVQVDPDCPVDIDSVGQEPEVTNPNDISGVIPNGNPVYRDRFVLYQNIPNPFDGYTVIGFELPEDADGRLTIYNASGQLLKEIKGEYKKGYNEVTVPPDELPVSGVLYYQLDTDRYTATKRMVKVK